MLRTSLVFVAIALGCLYFADIEVIALEPGAELMRMGGALLRPSFSVLWDFRQSLLNTVVFAITGTFLGVLGGCLFAFAYKYPVIRMFCAFLRSIHELFWAFLLLPVVGLTPICGILAIAIPYSSIFAKVYAEILEEADPKPLAGLPLGVSAINRFFYAILPSIYQPLRTYTFYRFECALRSSTILGFIGLPTLGYHLETCFREAIYTEAAALLYAFFFLIACLRFLLKEKLIPIYVITALFLVPREIRFSWENTKRLFTWDILPWPMRREGTFQGTQEIQVPIDKLMEWFATLAREQSVPGILNTSVLTQIVLVGSGLVALVLFPTISHHFTWKPVRGFARFGLIVMRSTPEYILAYLFILLWGPSMLPAIVAISLHNGAILAFLMGNLANEKKLRPDSSPRRLDRYFYWILPSIYGHFLAFLFYRWEIMMRESAILGILGIYTLGFFIDSGISEDKWDQVMVLIMVTAMLNIGLERVSTGVRRGLHVPMSRLVM